MSRIALPAVQVAGRGVYGMRVPIGRLVVAALLAIGCRADSVTMPTHGASECADQPGCRATDATPVDPVVFSAVSDARERLVPMLEDAAVRGALTGALQALDQALQANQSGVARTRLAEVYVHLDRLRIVVEGAAFDLPDVAAIRLALVPVANALGVKAL